MNRRAQDGPPSPPRKMAIKISVRTDVYFYEFPECALAPMTNQVSVHGSGLRNSIQTAPLALDPFSGRRRSTLDPRPFLRPSTLDSFSDPRLFCHAPLSSAHP